MLAEEKVTINWQSNSEIIILRYIKVKGLYTESIMLH